MTKSVAGRLTRLEQHKAGRRLVGAELAAFLAELGAVVLRIGGEPDDDATIAATRTRMQRLADALGEQPRPDSVRISGPND